MGFVLTDEGAAVLGHAERIEEEVLAFQRQLAGSEAELEGLLRLSSSDWFGTFMLAPVLAEFSRKPSPGVPGVADRRDGSTACRGVRRTWCSGSSRSTSPRSSPAA